MKSRKRFNGLLVIPLLLTWLIPGSAIAQASPVVKGEASSSDFSIAESFGADPLPSARDLSFSNALDLLETRNLQLMAVRDQEAAQRQKRSAVRGLRLPKIEVNGRATRMDDEIIFDLEPIRAAMLALHPTVPSAALPAFQSGIQDKQFYKAGVELSWPVYTGGAVSAANHAAAARLGDAEEQTRSLEQSLYATLVERYYGLCLAEQAAAIRIEVLEGMARHLDRAIRLEAEGLISRAERLHAEVSRAEAARELQSARQDVLLARAALRALLNEDADPRPSSGLFVLHELPELEVLQRDAADANPDLRRMDAQHRLAAAALKGERATYLPDVALFARYELFPEDLTELEPRWVAGIGFQLQVFDGFAREHRVKAARATVSMIDHGRQGARKEIALLVEHHYRRVVRALEQFDALEATIQLAEENLRVRRLAFEEGVATSLDVVDAATMLSGVGLARLAAAHDFVTSLAELLAATGQVRSFTEYMQSADVEVPS